MTLILSTVVLLGFVLCAIGKMLSSQRHEELSDFEKDTRRREAAWLVLISFVVSVCVFCHLYTNHRDVIMRMIPNNNLNSYERRDALELAKKFLENDKENNDIMIVEYAERKNELEKRLTDIHADQLMKKDAYDRLEAFKPEEDDIGDPNEAVLIGAKRKNFDDCYVITVKTEKGAIKEFYIKIIKDRMIARRRAF
jgi:hypothetical protein